MITIEDFNKVPENKLYDWLEDILVNKKKLTGDCWKEIYYSGFLNEVERKVNFENEGRWNVPVSIIFEFNNTYYSIWYLRGLTECQESEWETQNAVPVKKVEVMTYKWVAC